MEEDTGEMNDGAEMRAERPAVMDPAEFQRLGYLQEVNRQFLHPLGLALAVTVEEDGTTSIGPVYDGRSDPEGFTFAELTETDKAKAEFVEREWIRRMCARTEALDFGIQPCTDMDHELRDQIRDVFSRLGPGDAAPDEQEGGSDG